MKKAAVLFLLLLSGWLGAQNYQTGIGLRGGFVAGVSVRHMLSSSSAIEGIAASRWRGWNITGLYELQRELREEGLDWYYGGGLHIGGYNRYYYYKPGNGSYYSGSVFAPGIDGILGLEYTFADFPLNLSLDVHPMVEIADGGLWPWYDMALSIRYVIR